jgi:hypothetical protein
MAAAASARWKWPADMKWFVDARWVGGPSTGRILGPRDLADAFARLIFFFKNHGTLLITKYHYRVVCFGCTPEITEIESL